MAGSMASCQIVSCERVALHTGTCSGWRFTSVTRHMMTTTVLITNPLHYSMYVWWLGLQHVHTGQAQNAYKLVATSQPRAVRLWHAGNQHRTLVSRTTPRASPVPKPRLAIILEAAAVTTNLNSLAKHKLIPRRPLWLNTEH